MMKESQKVVKTMTSKQKCSKHAKQQMELFLAEKKTLLAAF